MDVLPATAVLRRYPRLPGATRFNAFYTDVEVIRRDDSGRDRKYRVKDKAGKVYHVHAYDLFTRRPAPGKSPVRTDWYDPETTL